MGFFGDVGGFFKDAASGVGSIVKPVANFGAGLTSQVVGGGMGILNNLSAGIGGRVGSMLDTFTNPLFMIGVIVVGGIIAVKVL
jgi:hypothetical protein